MDGDTVNDLQNMPCSIRRQRSKLSNDNLAILTNSKIALDADMISDTMACDDSVASHYMAPLWHHYGTIIKPISRGAERAVRQNPLYGIIYMASSI